MNAPRLLPMLWFNNFRIITVPTCSYIIDLNGIIIDILLKIKILIYLAGYKMSYKVYKKKNGKKIQCRKYGHILRKMKYRDSIVNFLKKKIVISYTPHSFGKTQKIRLQKIKKSIQTKK